MSPVPPLSLLTGERRTRADRSLRSADQPATLYRSAPAPCRLDIGVVDGLQALERRLGKSVLPDMLQVFEAHVPASCTDMRLAIEEGDTVTLRKISHKLKSSANCLGLTRLSAICAELERQASQDLLADAEGLLTTLEDEYDHASTTLRRYLHG